MTDLLAALSEPFDPSLVSWRVGATNPDKTKGMALAYIDARDVQDRLNAVCREMWQVRHPWATVDGTIACEIGIKIADEWIWRGDGAGKTDVESEKGSFSDSFKRAAVRWGIGRYLYDLKSPWVELETKGRSQVIKESEMPKLRAILGGEPARSPTRPAAKPEQTFVPNNRAIEARDNLVKTMEAATSKSQLQSIWTNHKALLIDLQKLYPKELIKLQKIAGDLREKLPGEPPPLKVGELMGMGEP